MTVVKKLLKGGATSFAVAAFVIPMWAGAANADTEVDPQTIAAMKDVSSGHYTDAELADIKSRPEIARIVPDPTQVPKLNFVTHRARHGSRFDPVNEWVEAYYSQKSVFGNNLYTWHFRVDWAHDHPNIVQWVNRTDWITDVDPVIYQREITADTASPLPATDGEVFRQRHIEHCSIKIACYANTYPHARIHFQGGGTWWVVDGGPK